MGNSGDGCELVLTLCTYDLRKSNLFVLSWARVQREMQGSISLELLIVVEVCAVFYYCLLWLETIDVLCIWCMFLCLCSDCMRYVEMFLCSGRC